MTIVIVMYCRLVTKKIVMHLLIISHTIAVDLLQMQCISMHTSLHDRTVGVEHHNGFEIYRQICQMIDAVPENAEFHMASDLTI